MSSTNPSIEKRKRPGVARSYRNEQIEVDWEPELCIHAAYCLRGLPQVFDRNRRPWVMVDAASAGEIAATIMQCPTGALSFRRSDGGPQEPLPEQATIEAQPDGPLYLRGNLHIVDQDGTVHELPRAALCRCGQSANKPFCDGTHRAIHFNTSTAPGEG